MDRKEIKSMTEMELRELLRANTNMTEHDIDKHMELGVMDFTNDAEGLLAYVQQCVDGFESDWELVIHGWQELEVVGDYRLDFLG